MTPVTGMGAQCYRCRETGVAPARPVWQGGLCWRHWQAALWGGQSDALDDREWSELVRRIEAA